MSASMSSDVRAEPNLVPLLDMVFQLITFFMLVINFKTAALDLNLHLPVVGSARPVEIKGEDLLVLNIDNQGTVKWLGNVYKDKDIPQFIANQAEGRLLVVRRSRSEAQSGDELDSMVVIRADRATPFRLLNRVIASCQENGFRNFALKAMDREEEGGGGPQS